LTPGGTALGRVPASQFAVRAARRVFCDGRYIIRDVRCRQRLRCDHSRACTFGATPLASVCDVCGKGPGFGNKISHSHRRTRRRWNPNIQTVRAVIGRTPKRMNVCTSCIKAGKVSR
jgi:large subunit ribosomal protein L28